MMGLFSKVRDQFLDLSERHRGETIGDRIYLGKFFLGIQHEITEILGAMIKEENLTIPEQGLDFQFRLELDENKLCVVFPKSFWVNLYTWCADEAKAVQMFREELERGLFEVDMQWDAMASPSLDA